MQDRIVRQTKMHQEILRATHQATLQAMRQIRMQALIQEATADATN